MYNMSVRKEAKQWEQAAFSKYDADNELMTSETSWTSSSLLH